MFLSLCISETNKERTPVDRCTPTPLTPVDRCTPHPTFRKFIGGRPPAVPSGRRKSRCPEEPHAWRARGGSRVRLYKHNTYCTIHIRAAAQRAFKMEINISWLDTLVCKNWRERREGLFHWHQRQVKPEAVGTPAHGPHDRWQSVSWLLQRRGRKESGEQTPERIS